MSTPKLVGTMSKDDFDKIKREEQATHELVLELGEKLESLDKKASPSSMVGGATLFFAVGIFVLLCVTLGVVVDNNNDISDVADGAPETVLDTRTSLLFTASDNPCEDAKPDDDAFNNFDCTAAIAGEVEQSGTDVTLGYVGDIDNSATPPIITSYFEAGLCPVNVHWHLGAEHRSAGQFDEDGTGPYDDYALTDDHRRLASGGVRQGMQCHHYDESQEMYTKPYDWKHCVDMVVGQTYEVHWPHSTVGMCGSPYQFQTPFYDGVFCGLVDNAKTPLELITDGDVTTHDNVGVQAQVFTIVNDEKYYYPDLMRGAINGGKFPRFNAGAFWQDVAYYTGSTTGTSRDNEVCSAYSPITWQVDRTCHKISASSFDKMCADMKTQADDMSDDLYAHGARELVDQSMASEQETR